MGRTPLVAIVDDEIDLVNILKMGFTKRGIPIAFVAYNGIEAVERFKQADTKPDVILMDYRMPGLDGFEAARQILAISPQVKIIFLTGYGIDKKEALKSGAIAIIKKPASLNVLVNAVCNAA